MSSIRENQEAMIAGVASAVINVLYADGCLRTCIHCKHFNEQAEVCMGLSRPPARIIAFGCDSFQQEGEPLKPAGVVIPPTGHVARAAGFGEISDDDIPF